VSQQRQERYPFFEDVRLSVCAEYVADVRGRAELRTVSQLPGVIGAVCPPGDNCPNVAGEADLIVDGGEAASELFQREMAGNRVMDFSRFKSVRELGTGSFGVVELRQHESTRDEIALKQIMNLSVEPDRFMREVSCLTFSHPCLLTLIGYSLPPPGLNKSAMIGTPYMPGGSLADCLAAASQRSRRPFWTPTGITIIIVGIALGLQFLHSRNIMHRDLKPANILLDGDGRPRIADFGCVRSTLDNTMATASISTPLYRPPEFAMGDEVHTTRADVYSFGLILYEILVGETVYSPKLNVYQLALQSQRPGNRPEIPDTVHSSVKTVIQRCWQVNPIDRLDVDEILDSFQANNYPFYADVDVKAVKSYISWVKKNEPPPRQ
jgi:serine/threonine protein kinase